MVERWADATWTVGHRVRHGRACARAARCSRSPPTAASSTRPPPASPRCGTARSLVEDLSRRDFTINAMAARLPAMSSSTRSAASTRSGERMLRTPGRPEDSFSDDPLRIMRAARFAAQLGFTVAPEVRAAMTEQAARLWIVSAERMTGELTKLMLAPDPAGASTCWFRPAWPTRCCRRCPALRMEADEHHRHKDVYEHSLTVLARPSSWSRGTGSTATWAAAGRDAARHRQAEDPVAAARREGGVPPARGGRREDGPRAG